MVVLDYWYGFGTCKLLADRKLDLDISVWTRSFVLLVDYFKMSLYFVELNFVYLNHRRVDCESTMHGLISQCLFLNMRT